MNSIIYPEKIKNPHDVFVGELITVIRCYENKTTVEHFIDDGLSLTLGSIAPFDALYVTVIAESPLNGAVYRFHGSGEYWEQIGTICGYV